MHYRTKDLYRVTHIATHVKTNESLVIYERCDNEAKVWARPYTNFFEEFIHEGKTIKRFHK